MTDPAPEIDIDEVRVRESGCAECARLREEAAGLAEAMHKIEKWSDEPIASRIAHDAIQRWVRS